MSKYTDTIKIIETVRKETDTAVLYYSAGGKDGIALLDMLASRFKKVICYYMYLIPNLDHIQPYIRWAENHYKNVEVRQIKHYQADVFERFGFFMDADPRYQLPKKDPNHLRERNVGDVEEWVRQETGEHYAFSGMKGVDGYMKRMRLLMYAKTGYIRKEGMVYPLALWTNKEVMQYIESRNLIKPFCYNPDKVSQGFGIDLETMLILRERYPRDLERMFKQYPYSVKVLIDYDKEKENETKQD